MRNVLCLLLCGGIAFSLPGLAQSKKPAQPAPSNRGSAAAANPRITFVEIGSVNCIPCKAMQPVMKAIEAKYGSQIKVIFYDIWTKEQAHYGQEYKIRLIPTQVFLDSTGKELMRHEGFYPEEAIDMFLQSKGLKPNARDQG